MCVWVGGRWGGWHGAGDRVCAGVGRWGGGGGWLGGGGGCVGGGMGRLVVVADVWVVLAVVGGRGWVGC